MYEVELDAELPADAEVAFTDGRIVLDGAPCAPAQLRRVGPRHAEVTLVEGKYHQVKRMFAAQARRASCVAATIAFLRLTWGVRMLCSRASQRCGVVKLHRSRFGDYGVEGLAPGEFRILPLPPWAAAAGGQPAAAGEHAASEDA